jgi:hypothetical protein
MVDRHDSAGMSRSFPTPRTDEALGRGRLFGGFAMSEQDSNDTTTLEFSRRALLVGVASVGGCHRACTV